MQRPVYLDYNSTTPTDARVLEAMRPYFAHEFGNAGSRTHAYGQFAKQAAEAARAQVAALLGVETPEIVFTSGATESNNAALLGLARHGLESSRRHVLTTAIEHKSVLEPLAKLGDLGFEVELAPVTAGGFVDPDAIRARLRPDTLLVSVMHANNETGVLQPVREIGALLEGSRALYHVDAAQTFGKEVEVLKELRCDFLSISGHKVYGPKGVGALYVRQRVGRPRILTALLYGGGQEKGLRPGTLPVPLVVGLGAAAALAADEYQARRVAAARVKEQFLGALAGVDHRLNGDQARTQAHVVNVSFPGVDSEALMIALRYELAISNGAACTSTSYAPSHVLQAMGLSEETISSAVRISWGPGVTAIPAGLILSSVARLGGGSRGL